MTELAFGTVGRVRVLHVSLGAQVKKGQVLAELENQDLLQARDVAEREYTRVQDLHRTRVLTEQDLDRAHQALDLARITFEKSLIRAPFDGFVAELNLEVGQLSQITAVVPKPLIRLVDVAPRYVSVEIDEVDLSRIALGMPARIKILAVRRAPFKATIRQIIPYVSSVREQDRTVQIELTLDQEGLLLPEGASADVEIITARKEQALSIPVRALLGFSDQRFVYLLTSDNRLRKQPVTPGLSNYERVEILEGLSEGQTVVLPSAAGDLQEGQEVVVTLLP
jgi:HlyD family secretion protein